MATHDYVIDNSTGANVRADINLVLQAILTNNSSSSAPSTTAAYMWWADTTNGVLKIRNSSNNDWVELLQLDGTLTLEDGSASTPGLAFRDDLNTGIFSSAADTFNVATAGVERMELGATTIFNESGADVDFRIEGDTDVNNFYLDASTNRIGIGQSAPEGKLHIENASSGASYSPDGSDILIIENNDSCGIDLRSPAANSCGINFSDTVRRRGGITYSHSTDAFSFLTAGSVRATLDSSGRLLIGITSARGNFGNNTSGVQQHIQLEGTSSITSSMSLIRNSNDSADSGIIVGKTRGTSVGSNTVVQAGDDLGNISFVGADGTSMQFGADIKATVESGVGNDDMPAALVFSTNGGTTSTTERMRIDSSGNVGIGTTSPSEKLTISSGNLNFIGGTNDAQYIKFGDSGDDDIGNIFYFHGNNNMVFTTNASEAMRIDSSGRVGIGITSPDQKLVVADTSSVSLIRVTANNAQEAGIDFGDTDDNDIGRIRYDNSVNAMRFFVNAAERMRIDSSGRFGLGVSSLGSAFIEARQNSPVAGRLLALGSNGTSTTDTASGMSNALVLFRNRKEVLPNQTTDLVSGYGGSLVLITILNSSGDNVQQTRVRSHAWNSSIQLFSNSYGAVSPTITFSTASGVLKVNHSSNGNLIFNCAGFIISAPHTG